MEESSSPAAWRTRTRSAAAARRLSSASATSALTKRCEYPGCWYISRVAFTVNAVPSEPDAAPGDTSTSGTTVGVDGTFMMRSRRRKNSLAAKGLVKKSASFSAVGTKGTLI